MQTDPFEQLIRIKCKLLYPDSLPPSRKNIGDAGYDLFAYLDKPIDLQPSNRVLIPTGISLQMPPFIYGRIAPRSGLAFRGGLDILGGVIDSGYRGEIGVVIINLGAVSTYIKKGDRIAQIIFTMIARNDLVVVDELDDTDRSVRGFGSTGI